MILLCSLLFSYCGVSTCIQICKGQDEKTKCCLGYVWNETLGSCSACNDGYIGENCRTTCPELYFGRDCRLKCNCTKDQCNHIAGCSKSASEDNTSTTLLAERNPCIRKKTEALDNPSLLLGMYYAVVSLVIFSAVMIVLYIALFIFAKR